MRAYVVIVNRIVPLGMALFLAGCTSLAAPTGVPGSGSDPLATTPALLLEPLKGGLVSGPLGEGLSEREKLRAVAAEYRALETAFGQPPTPWSDERTGANGEVVAGVPYRVGSQNCRAYTHRVSRDAVERTANGSACRAENGSWLRLD
jgi:surface antigen